MRGVYRIVGSALTLAGAVTLLFVNPGTTVSLKIRRVAISQKGVTATAMQRVQLVTQVTAFPTLTSVTPAKTTPIDQASAITGGTAGAAGTCGVNASAEGAGAKTVVDEDVFNVLTGYLWVPSQGEEQVMSAGGAAGFGVYLPDAPGTASGWTAKCWYEEI